jgi:hypothetical protein
MVILADPLRAGNSCTPWSARNESLVAWAWDRLVNRTDAWGAYWPLHRRDAGNSWTAPARRLRGRVLLTPDVLARHFLSKAPEHVIGLHSTSPANTSLWGALDIDWHGPTSTNPAANLAAALAWYSRLRRLGFTPLLTDSNGRGGYHLRTLFSGPVPTPLVFAFLHWLVADHAEHGLPHRPETFPKQPRIDPGRFGNWLRLPGRHHSREYWSRVWDGSHWLEGAAAVEFLLALAGDPPGLIPANLPVPRRAQAVASGPTAPATDPPPGDLTARITAYLGKLPSGLGEGEHRDDVAFHFGAFLVRDLGLPDEEALAWLNRWDGRNRARKGQDRLKAVLANVHLYARNARGCGLHRPNPARAPRGKHQLSHIRFVVEV